jgi:hypothetical protein
MVAAVAGGSFLLIEFFESGLIARQLFWGAFSANAPMGIMSTREG